MNCLYSHIVLFFQLIEWDSTIEWYLSMYLSMIVLINDTIFFWGLLFPLSLTIQEPKGFIQSHRIGSSSTHQVHSWVVCSVPSFLLLLFYSVQYSVARDNGIPWCCRLLFCCHYASSLTQQMFSVITSYVPDRVLCSSGNTKMTKRQTPSFWSLHSSRKGWWQIRKSITK